MSKKIEAKLDEMIKAIKATPSASVGRNRDNIQTLAEIIRELVQKDKKD